MVAASSSPVSSTTGVVRSRSRGSSQSSYPVSFAKASRARRPPTHRHHPYSGTVPHTHITSRSEIDKTEGRMRLATLRKLRVALDIRDELEQREATEVAALAELGAGVTALCECVDSLERRIRALYPEWPGFAPDDVSDKPELEVGDEGKGEHDAQKLELAPVPGSGTEDHHRNARSSTGTMPTLGSPTQSPALMTAPISALAVSPGRNCIPLPPPHPGFRVSSPLAIGRSL